jgi:hypothetical protein
MPTDLVFGHLPHLQHCVHELGEVLRSSPLPINPPYRRLHDEGVLNGNRGVHGPFVVKKRHFSFLNHSSSGDSTSIFLVGITGLGWNQKLQIIFNNQYLRLLSQYRRQISRISGRQV